MRPILIFFFVVCGTKGLAQDAIHNFGPLQLHDTGSVGIHSHLINDGDFDQNKGLVGFYGIDKFLNVSGSKTPIFYDTEIAVDQGLYLYTGIEIVNNSNLVIGNVVTPRTNTNIFPNFLDNAFYAGESNSSLVDGYTAIINKDVFTFPVGDDDRLRTLTLHSSDINKQAMCAYFYENPNAPSTFAKSFDTNQKTSEYLSISENEFWHLEGSQSSIVTLTWDDWSDVGSLATYVSDIKVVGWHKTRSEWINLGNSDVQGDMFSGSVTSEEFLPNDYEIITLGGNSDKIDKFELVELGNYFMTPNGDGKNDYLELSGLEKSPNNSIQIFNRYGILVYSKKNYQNEFNGISQGNAVITKDKGLPSGVYFYLVNMYDIRQKHQGYLYISSEATN